MHRQVAPSSLFGHDTLGRHTIVMLLLLYLLHHPPPHYTHYFCALLSFDCSDLPKL